MTITTDWIDSFKDPAMQKPLGKGAFFSGVVLGFIARCQAGKDGSLSSAPLFKKLSFGKLKKTRTQAAAFAGAYADQRL